MVMIFPFVGLDFISIFFFFLGIQMMSQCLNAYNLFVKEVQANLLYDYLLGCQICFGCPRSLSPDLLIGKF